MSKKKGSRPKLTFLSSPESGECYSCDGDCSSEYYCHGCGEFICKHCSLNDSLTSCHDPSEHLEDPELEEEDD